jgi:hypothetical protein
MAFEDLYSRPSCAKPKKGFLAVSSFQFGPNFTKEMQSKAVPDPGTKHPINLVILLKILVCINKNIYLYPFNKFDEIFKLCLMQKNSKRLNLR